MSGKSEFDYVESTVKLSGDAPAPRGREEMEHGEEVYFVARGVITEVSFPEDAKSHNIKRVAKVKLEKAFVVDGEGAERLIAAERERISGQGNIIAEINRANAALESDDEDTFNKDRVTAADDDDDIFDDEDEDDDQ